MKAIIYSCQWHDYSYVFWLYAELVYGGLYLGTVLPMSSINVRHSASLFMFLPWRQRHCIKFFSHYFSFPLSLSFHHCSILIHPPPMLYNVFLPLLQFYPVSIVPPLLHTHSPIYHPCYIKFFSQYFSFPLSVSFHHCSIRIKVPSTFCNINNWQLSLSKTFKSSPAPIICGIQKKNRTI